MAHASKRLTLPDFPESLPEARGTGRPWVSTLRRAELFTPEGENMNENRLGIIGIIVEDIESSAALNAILHQYADIIVGRLGIPYRDRGVSIISLAVDGSRESISAMTEKLGQLNRVSVNSVITEM